MEQALPEIDKVVQMSKLFSIGTNEILLEDEELNNLRAQELHLDSIYLIARDFEKSICFYEKLLSMTVSTRNCGNKFAEFFFDNKCLAIMNEENLYGHQNKEYCKYCFPNGKLGKHETMEEMIESCIPFWLNDVDCKTAEDAKRKMMTIFPNLKRWRDCCKQATAPFLKPYSSFVSFSNTSL